MRVVDHMLVEHGIGIADYKRILILESKVLIYVVFVAFFMSCWEEHSVDFCPRLFVLNPKVLPFEAFGQNCTHLLVLAKK